MKAKDDHGEPPVELFLGTTYGQGWGAALELGISVGESLSSDDAQDPPELAR